VNIQFNSSLTLNGAVTVTGPNAADFTILQQPVGPLNSTNSLFGSSVMEISFDPSGAGLRTATITISSNDPDEGTYTFDVAGTGLNSLPNAPSDTKVLASKVVKVKYDPKNDVVKLKGKFEVGNGGPSPSEGAIVRIYVAKESTFFSVSNPPIQTIVVKPVAALADPSKEKLKKISFNITVPGFFAWGRVYATISPLPGTLKENYWLDNVSYHDFTLVEL